MEFITRAILDSFWSRESSTVETNLRSAVRGERAMERFGFPSLTPPMGPFPLQDDWGMKAAVAILDRSFDPGTYEDRVQFETFRKLRSSITNITQSGVAGLGDVIGAYERNRTWISRVQTHSVWFATRFMKGLERRHGQVVKQDWAPPISVIHAIDSVLEVRWNEATCSRTRKKCAEMGAWFICGFCSGLRGEEMVLIELVGTFNSLRFLEDRDVPHFCFVVTGRTKSNRASGAKFELPIASVTRGTGLRPGKWIKRLVECIRTEGRKRGRLFQRNLEPPLPVEFQDDFLSVLEFIQATTDLIPQELDVREEAGILRSLRRALTDHSRNIQVPTHLLKAFNRWHKERKGDKVEHDMVDRYSTLGNLKPLFLEFSLSL